MDCSKETMCDILGISEEDTDWQQKAIQMLISDPEGYRRKVLQRYLKKEQTTQDLCSKCKGKCCKHAPCHYSPEDFEEISFDSLKKQIEKGHISIVSVSMREYDEDDMLLQAYILRPRGKDRPISDYGSPLDIPCSLLTETGCSLSYEDRPMGGKMLIARENGACMAVYESDMCINDWKPYQDILEELFELYYCEY